MEISSYTVTETLPSRGGFYFGYDRRFGPGDTVLIKAYEPTPHGVYPESYVREGRLLNWLKLPMCRLVDSGRDNELGLYYYAALVPGRFTPVSFEDTREDDRLRLLLAIAKAVADLNAREVAYRNFAPSAFGRLSETVLLYDLARATRFTGGRVRPPCDKLEGFDPPEARNGDYDLVTGEVYGLGRLIREAKLSEPRITALSDRMTDPRPESRVTSVAEVAEELATL